MAPRASRCRSRGQILVCMDTSRSDVAGYLVRMGGTARTGQLLAAGHSRRAVGRALDSGSVLRAARGVLTLPDADADHRANVAAGCLTTCVSAAEGIELWTLQSPAEPHLWSAHGRFPAAAVGHRGTLRGKPLAGSTVSVLDAVVHTLRCRPGLEALVVAESAVVQRRVSVADLLAALPGNRNGAARTVVGRIGTGAESILELIARELFVAVGLSVQAQVVIDGVGRVDLLVEERVVVELDGFAFHGDRQAFVADRRRGNAATLRSLPTLRFTYEDVMGEPDRVVADVVALVRRTARVPW